MHIYYSLLLSSAAELFVLIQTDPIIDSVLETVASDSERVDHALSNGGSGLENKENGRKSENEVPISSLEPSVCSALLFRFHGF